MGIKICPKCQGKVSTSRNICIHCGYVFPSYKRCPDCGETVHVNTKECPTCGYPFEQLEIEDPVLVVEDEVFGIKTPLDDLQINTTIAEPEVVEEIALEVSEPEEPEVQVVEDGQVLEVKQPVIRKKHRHRRKKDVKAAEIKIDEETSVIEPNVLKKVSKTKFRKPSIIEVKDGQCISIGINKEED